MQILLTTNLCALHGFCQSTLSHCTNNTPKQMAPQKKKEVAKKTGSPKKIAAKKTFLKKTANKKAFSNKKATPMKISPKKVSSKMIFPKKKIVSKNTAAKKQAAKKSTLKKSSEERAARAARRSLAKDAATADNQPERKKARLGDASSNLLNLLTTSAGVLDIFAASGSRPLTKETMGGALEVETIYFDKLKLMNTSR